MTDPVSSMSFCAGRRSSLLSSRSGVASSVTLGDRDPIAARSQLPADLPGQPGYRKVNPADSPIMLLSLSSDNISPAQIYDAADSILAQKLALFDGVFGSSDEILGALR